MTVYIAASWKHRHAVELLTDRLESIGLTVASFVRNASDVEPSACGGQDPEAWIESEDGAHKFRWDLHAATHSDLVIYIGPSGCDAWAEVGAAWASKVPVYGLRAKGESVGLMRRMVAAWFDDSAELLNTLALELEQLELAARRRGQAGGEERA